MHWITRLTLLVSFTSLATATATASDWPQWLGQNRDSIWQEDGLLEKFPEAGPKVLWRAPVGYGYAGPAVVDGRVYVMDYQKTGGKIANNPVKP